MARLGLNSPLLRLTKTSLFSRGGFSNKSQFVESQT